MKPTAASLTFAQRLHFHLPPGQSLDPAIVGRFDAHNLSFQGVMDTIYCSRFGRFFAHLLKHCSLLPRHCAANVPAEFSVRTLDTNTLHKQRDFHFESEPGFSFQSQFFHEPRLGEQLTPRWGMWLRVVAKPGQLWLFDDGYFVQWQRRKIAAPKWLGPRFALLHQNISTHDFHVSIRISHAWLGTLFYQRGKFWT